jgi:hypothetical protein
VAKATLGGMTILGSAPARWCLREGTNPVIEFFDLRPEDAQALLGSTSAVTLHFEVPGGAVDVKELWVLYEAPSDTPYYRRVAVADRRWFWPYAHVLRRYNMRKRTGVKRATSIDGVPENDPVLDNVAFHEWSLYSPVGDNGSPSKRWRAVQALNDTMTDLLEPDMSSVASIRVDLPQTAKDVPMEDVQIDDQGDAALHQLLKYLPEARVWIDYDGTIVIDSRVSGGEVNMVGALGSEIVGGGHVVRVNNALLRPKKINFYYTREIELRLDFAEPDSVSNTTAAMQAEDRVVENVLPSPDYQLEVNGQKMPEGAWITLPQAMVAWGDITASFGKLDYDILCKAFVPFMDLWGILQNLVSLHTDVDWGSRFAVLQSHWRQTFRLNPRWLARILSLRAYRVATIDRALGSRAPAIIYSNWCALGTQRLYLKNIIEQQKCEYARNYDVFPADGILGSDNRPAPATVTILDEDQGIIRADYQVDTVRLTDMVLPGVIEENCRPTARIDMAGRSFDPITFDSVITGTEADRIPRLKRSHKAAIILTAVPGAPNNRTQLQKVTVFPTSNAGACQGPEWHVRIGSNIETARYQWSDDKASLIEQAFGVGADVAAANASDALTDMEGLCINLESGAVGAASLRAISDAAAARLWASLADHMVGTASGMLNAALWPAGWLGEVCHEIAAQTGAGTTRVTLPEQLPRFNLFGYMDSNTRAVVLKQVEGK